MKRLNIKLLVWLVVLPIVFGVGIHFLHGYQINRNAGALKAQAEEAVKHGETEEAIGLYVQYLKHRPGDRDAYGALAGLAADAAEKPNATRRELFRAYQVMEEATRRHSDLTQVRERLIDYTMKLGRFGDAMDHIDVLRQGGNGSDPKFDVKYAQCLLATGREEKAIKLLAGALGYDTARQAFSPKPGTAVHEIDAYVLLAEIFRRQTEDSKEASKIIDWMVAANPEDAKAYASRGRFLQRDKKLKEAAADLKKARELAPDDADILISAAEVEGALKNFEEAGNLLKEGLKKHPQDDRIYRTLASLALQRKNAAEALKYVEEGLEKAPGNQFLLLFRADLELQNGDIDGVRRTVAEMKSREFLPELIEYIECRILISEQQWSKASTQLEELRPLMARFPDLQLQIDMLLGQCYQSRGQPDKAMDAFRRALDANPSLLPAQLGYANALRSVGKSQQAESVLRQVQDNLATGEGPVAKTANSSVLQLAVAEEMRKADDERDWTTVDRLLEQVLASDSMSKPQEAVLEAEIALIKKDMKHARAVLSRAVKEYPKELAVWLGLINLIGQDKSSKYTVDDVLDRAEKELGPVIQLQQIRLANAVRKEGKEALAAVQKLEADSQRLTEQEQMAYLADLGNAYYRLKNYENARRCWLKVAESRPDDTKILLTLYELAQEFGNEADMDATLRAIQATHGANSSLLQFCQAEQILWKVRQKKADRKALAQARERLGKARKARPDWHEIARLSAEIAELEGRTDEAITEYQKALELGPPNPNISRRLVALLYVAGRMNEVDQAMQSMGPLASNDPLKRVAIERDLRTGKLDEALTDAKKVVDADPDNAASQLWYGQLLSRANRNSEAQEAFRAAVKKDPKLVQGWLLLIAHLSGTKQLVDAEAVIHEAEKAVPEKEQPAFLASAYEMIGDKKRSEENFLRLLEIKPGDTTVLRGLAAFYVRNNEPEKARKYLDAMLALPVASDPSASNTDRDNIAWGRRALAQVIAADGEYRSLTAALKILEGNRVNGVLPPGDVLLSATMLAKRPEYASRSRAVKLLEGVQERYTMSPDELFGLAQLYEQTGDWSKARDTVINIVAKVPGNPMLWNAFAQMLLKHNALTEAEHWIAKVEEAQPKSPAAVELRARLLAKQGKPEEAGDLLVKLLNSAPNEETRLQMTTGVVALLEEFRQPVAAEAILRKAVAEHPRATIVLASFLGRHGDLNETFSLLEESRKSHPLGMIIQAGLEVLRRRVAEADKQHFAKIDAWMKTALEAEPNSLTLRLQKAELQDIQGQSAEVVSMYRAMLNDKSLDTKQRAIVQNNLAFVLATSGNSGDVTEALQLINEAIDVLGPSSDLLDTRAICYLTQGDTRHAVEDLRAAIIDSPSPVKYIHLAMAEAKAGNKAAARTAIERAREMKFEVNELSAKERQNYEQVSRGIEGG